MSEARVTVLVLLGVVAGDILSPLEAANADPLVVGPTSEGSETRGGVGAVSSLPRGFSRFRQVPGSPRNSERFSSAVHSSLKCGWLEYRKLSTQKNQNQLFGIKLS